MRFEEKTVRRNYIYKGKILSLRKDDVELPNGKPAIREVIEHHGGAAVYCEKDGKVLMVRQFRYPYKEEVLEIPAGKIETGETPLSTAKRELSEEGGMEAEKFTLLFEVYPSPGYTDEKLYIYKAEGLKETDIHLDEDEFLSSEWIDKSTLSDMIKSGKIKDAKTLLGLLACCK